MDLDFTQGCLTEKTTGRDIYDDDMCLEDWRGRFYEGIYLFIYLVSYLLFNSPEMSTKVLIIHYLYILCRSVDLWNNK